MASAGPKMQMDLEIERNELMRLMATAKNDERKAIIRDSLVSLESPEGAKKKGLASASHRHHSMFETEKIATETVFHKSPPMRPMSARLRRPSMNNLDVIQEEKKLSTSFENKSIDTSRSFVDVKIEDVDDISTSSYDPRQPLWNPFSSSSKVRWVSTGLMPQFVSISFKLSWLIVEVKIKCRGVRRATLSMDGSVTRIPFRIENSTTLSCCTNDQADNITSILKESRSDKILIQFEDSTETFVTVENIYIKAVSPI